MIPRVFHRAWLGGPEPAWLRPFAASWERCNPGWRLESWDDERVARLGLRHQDLYDQAEQIAGRLAGQFRADILRLELLERYGGVWVDADQEALAPIEPHLQGISAFAAWEDSEWIANGVMGAVPGHPFIRRLVDGLPASVAAHPGARPAMMTGPRYVTREWRQDPGDFTVLDKQLFYPYLYDDLQPLGRDYPGSVAVHHWHNKRRDSMPRLSVAVMAHPKRKQWIPGLLEDLGRGTVVWDRKNDRWDTGRRSLLAFDPQATHHLVIQDDAVVSRDLVPAVEEALRYSGQHPVSLYVGKRRPNTHLVVEMVAQAQKRGHSWIYMRGPLWGPAIVLPVADIPHVVAWGDAHPEIPNYDLRIADYYSQHRVDCLYTVPSLVDHRDTPENPSLVPGRTASGRVAHTFIGASRSGLEIDWSRLPERDSRWTLGVDSREDHGMGKQRIATERIYAVDKSGARYLVAAVGDLIPDWYQPPAPPAAAKKVEPEDKAMRETMVEDKAAKPRQTRKVKK